MHRNIALHGTKCLRQGISSDNSIRLEKCISKMWQPMLLLSAYSESSFFALSGPPVFFHRRYNA